MPSIQRAQLLLQQQRFDLAEQELRGLLSEDSQQAELHSLLALCLVNDPSRLKEATDEAELAVGLAPDIPFVHYVLGRVFLVRNRTDEARQAAEEAIRLDPYDAEHFGLLSQIELVAGQWQKSLNAAEQGLTIDAEDDLCNNLRSISLERLGRSSEALDSARKTLSRSPDNAMSHVSFGWAALSAGDYRQAQESFREALRLDPMNEAARDGMINALNSRSFVFRAIYRFFVGISRLGAKYQFAIIFGAWIVMQLLGKLGRDYPAMSPFVLPLTIAYFGFVLLTWIAKPLFNTILRFHPFGRHLLNRREIWASNLIAVCLLSAVIGGGYAISKLGGSGILVAGYWIVMMIPVAATFQQKTTMRTVGVGIASVVIGLIPVYGIVMRFATQSPESGDGTVTTFAFSILVLQIVSGVMAQTAVRS